MMWLAIRMDGLLVENDEMRLGWEHLLFSTSSVTRVWAPAAEEGKPIASQMYSPLCSNCTGKEHELLH